MYLPYFGQYLESKKRVAGILAHVCLVLSVLCCNIPALSWQFLHFTALHLSAFSLVLNLLYPLRPDVGLKAEHLSKLSCFITTLFG